MSHVNHNFNYQGT